jgi:hypothetical protein
MPFWYPVYRSNSDKQDIKTSVVWCKTDQNPRDERFLGTTSLNVVTDSPESVDEVVSSVIGHDLIQLFTE